MKIDDVSVDLEDGSAFIVLTRIVSGKRYVHRVPLSVLTAKSINKALQQIQFESHS